MTTYMPATLLCDFYKVSHKELYPKGTEKIYSTFTPRSNKYFPKADKVVVFGIQAFVKKYLIDYFDNNFFNRDVNEVLSEYERIIKHTLGVENPNSEHIKALHTLGHLPIKLSALAEGTLAPIKIPVLTIENTHKDFFWLTNYLETIISTELWQAMTSATKALQYRKILDRYAMKTTGSTDGVEFQAHDFSMRGMSGLESASISGAAHLTSFVGTDTIPSILFMEQYYNANVENELVGTSIVATEHSIMSALTPANTDRNEYKAFKYLITEANPKGFMSIVSDTYDFWSVVDNVLPALKNEIMNRDGKVVIRPDSGVPEEVLCGIKFENLDKFNYITEENIQEVVTDWLHDELVEETPHGEYGCDTKTGMYQYKGKYYKATIEVEYNRYDKQYYYIDGCELKSFVEVLPTSEELGLIESLWNIFGGTINEQGFKMLDSHIGAIYGDSITLERAERILRRLEEKGFASTNVVLGVGSYSYQYNTRDTLGFAMKATYAEINGEPTLLFKDPKTDDGTKRSQKGKVFVSEVNGEITTSDGYIDTSKIKGINLLQPVFEDGKLKVETSLWEIRNRIKNSN